MGLHLFNISTLRFTVAEFSQFVDVYAITLMAIFVDSTNVTDHLVRVVPLIKLHGSLKQRVTGNSAKRQLIIHLCFGAVSIFYKSVDDVILTFFKP